MPHSAAFWDRFAARYAARPLDYPEAHAATLDRVRAHLRASDRVLELGAGTGSTAILLAPGVAHYVATDFSPRMLEIARARPEGAALPGLTFEQADIAGAPEGPFDAILAFSLLHLLQPLPDILAAIRRRLPPGGLFISKTPCLADLGLWLRVVIPALQAIGKAPSMRFLGRSGLERAIGEAGFEIIERGDYPAARAARFVVARAR